jgi:hypothetical protein
MRRLLAVGVLGLLAACGTMRGPGGIVGPGGLLSREVVGSTAWDDRPDGKTWSQMTRLAIDSDGVNLLAAVPKDIDAFCPNYASLEAQAKREFWVVLVAEIASIESGLDPNAAKMSPVSPGLPANARRGLMQISADAARRYGCANVGAAQLNDPQTNLGCGVRILAATSGKDQVVTGYTTGGWRGAARYWSDLRKPETLADVQQRLNDQSFCRRKTS